MFLSFNEVGTEDRIPNEEALEKYKEAREMYFNLCLKSEIDYLTECGFICVEKTLYFKKIILL